MNKQDRQEPNNQQPVIEDLTVNEGEAEEVKGGAANMFLRFNCEIKGE